MTRYYISDNKHSAVLRTLPSRSLNRRICGSAFSYAQISQGETSHISGKLSEIAGDGLSEKGDENVL